MRKEILSGWGRHHKIEALVSESRSSSDVQSFLKLKSEVTIRGQGRSYGDSSLGKHVLLSGKMDNLLAFDHQSGVLECGAGISLDEVIRIFIPRGWFPPVTPGTRFVSLGGMLASDVHGKNHHKVGSFSNHVLGFSLQSADGKIYSVNRNRNKSLFLATAGGMGLTGMIQTLRFQMIPIHSSWIRQTTLKMNSLEELMDHFDSTAKTTYSVAWIDCLAKGNQLGRSLLILGEHAIPEELPNSIQNAPFQLNTSHKLQVPFDFPSFILNPLSVKAFNTLYYHRIQKKEVHNFVSLIPFFYPLDAIQQWNRIYGSRGFFQYQCVLPRKPNGVAQLRKLLETISNAGEGSFLAILKLLGPEDPPYLAFAKEGYTLSLDFPYHLNSLKLIKSLDQIVLQSGGRLYLTKDAHMSPSMFKSGYPHLEQFLEVKRKFDPHNVFTSIQAQRLELVA